MRARRALATIALSLLGAACGDEERTRDVEMESTSGSTRSHFPNQNCQACHKLDDRTSPGGDTPGFFSVAGAVRETDGTAHPNATVIIYDRLFDTETQQPGNEVMRVEADALGMFYTTKPLPEVVALDEAGNPSGERYFPAVLDNDTGVVKHMYYGVNSGSCNVCHQDLYRDMSPRDDIEGDPFHQAPSP
jgi:mono/diheme cytochrome c family protein